MSCFDELYTKNAYHTHFLISKVGYSGLVARYDLTQEQLAKEVGVRRETIGYLEKGDYNPSLKLAAQVARVLNSTIEELFIFEANDLL